MVFEILFTIRKCPTERYKIEKSRQWWEPNTALNWAHNWCVDSKEARNRTKWKLLFIAYNNNNTNRRRIRVIPDFMPGWHWLTRRIICMAWWYLILWKQNVLEWVWTGINREWWNRFFFYWINEDPGKTEAFLK